MYFEKLCKLIYYGFWWLVAANVVLGFVLAFRYAL